MKTVPADIISKKPARSKRVKIGVGVVITLLLMVVLAFYYSFDPQRYLLFPKCLFRLMTGYQCPGCGSQRAIHSLLHLRIGEAFRYNAFMVLALPYVLLGTYLQYFGGNRRFPKWEKWLFGKWAALLWLIFIFTYWILRNVR